MCILSFVCFTSWIISFTSLHLYHTCATNLYRCTSISQWPAVAGVWQMFKPQVSVGESQTCSVERNMRTKQWCHILSSDPSIIVTCRAAVCVGGFCGCVCVCRGWGVSPCSCPKMKEASPDENSQTWKRRGEELGKGREVGGNENSLRPSICPQTRGLKLASGGISRFAFTVFFPPALGIF